MAIATFTRQVSRGSRFNQIYVPKEMNETFGPGDEVEIRLIKKATLRTEKNVILSKERRDLADQILKFFSERKIKALIFGSFVKSKNFRDIDIMITSNMNKEQEIKFQETFGGFTHLIKIPENKLAGLYERCPITKSMLEAFISNFSINFSGKRKIDKNHIKYLLMMPEDILEFELDSRLYYDNLRKLFTIEYFLKDKKSKSELRNRIIEKSLGVDLAKRMSENDLLTNAEYIKVKDVIRKKIKLIKGFLNVEKR